MSQEAMQAFVEHVNDDETFHDGLIAADDNDARLRIAQESGFDITAEDLAALRRQTGVEELSEEDLQRIARRRHHRDGNRRGHAPGVDARDLAARLA